MWMPFSCGIQVTPGPFQVSYPTSVYILHSTPTSTVYPCANVSITSSHCHTGWNHPRHHHLVHSIVYGDREPEYPGDMSAILTYERLDYIDDMRVTLCSIPFYSVFHDYLPGHRSHAAAVTVNKSTCRNFCYLVTVQVREGFSIVFFLISQV